MSDKPKITIEPFAGTVTVSFSDAIVASTREALRLNEEGHDPVFYIPYDDIYFEFLSPSDTTYHCPLKGNARYWNAQAVGEFEADVMWAYETPLPSVSKIRRHGAFDPEKVQIKTSGQEDLLHTPHVP